VLRRKQDFSVQAEMPHYRYPTDAEHLREGLLKAGPPELTSDLASDTGRWSTPP
jgi:hypothetical protein